VAEAETTVSLLISGASNVSMTARNEQLKAKSSNPYCDMDCTSYKHFTRDFAYLIVGDMSEHVTRTGT
jgi:hypothetical protein